MNFHPDYARYLDQWTKLQDFYEGSDAVKLKTTKYLKPTSSMIFDGFYGNRSGCVEICRDGETLTSGRASYDSYIFRAHVPDYIKPAVSRHVGYLTNYEPQIIVPEQMQALMYGKESLALIIRSIYKYQLLFGRVLLLLDIDEKMNLPVVNVYSPLQVVNWGMDEEGRSDFVEIDNSGYFLNDDFTYSYREEVLRYVFDGKSYWCEDRDGLNAKPITYFGKHPSASPFVFANVDNFRSAEIQGSPMLPLLYMAQTVYSMDADYRQALYMTGQDTLVISGALGGMSDPNMENSHEAIRTGAGAVLMLESGGSAKYAGVDSTGLTEMRHALEMADKSAQYLAGTLISSDRESGESLKTRVGTQTISLKQIADTGAEALETALENIASWMGLSTDTVSVTPNKDFTETGISGQDTLSLMQSKLLGLPVSMVSIHDYLAKKGITSLSYEDDMKLIEEEKKEQLLEAGEEDDSQTDSDIVKKVPESDGMGETMEDMILKREGTARDRNRANKFAQMRGEHS